MHTVSFDKVLNITIFNQYTGLRLTSPVYYSNGTACHMSPNQQTDNGTIMEASFGACLDRKLFKGALLYKLQRKHTDRTDNQSNSGIAFTEDTSTNIHLVISWDYRFNYKFYVCLIECTNDFTLDEDKLWAWYREHIYELHKKYKSKVNTWLIYDGTIMKTKLDITYGLSYKLDIVISEGAEKYNMIEPMKVDPKRLVLSLLMLVVLIYAVSLLIPSSLKLNIHNQCLNVSLAYPVYVTGDGLKCHRPPDYKVCAGDTVRSGFMIKKYSNESYGVLIYRLQRKQAHKSTEISEDTSSAAHLLVLWVIHKFNRSHTNVLLVEHEKEFIWIEDDLRKLYTRSHNHLMKYDSTTRDTWIMDDNMMFKTSLKVSGSKKKL
jgi:hypothetical protein